jgi:hypothetical protein
MFFQQLQADLFLDITQVPKVVTVVTVVAESLQISTQVHGQDMVVSQETLARLHQVQ